MHIALLNHSRDFSTGSVDSCMLYTSIRVRLQQSNTVITCMSNCSVQCNVQLGLQTLKQPYTKDFTDNNSHKSNKCNLNEFQGM